MLATISQMNPVRLFGFALVLLLAACGGNPSGNSIAKDNNNSPSEGLAVAKPVDTSSDTDVVAMVWAEWLEVRKDGRACLRDTNATFSGRVVDYYQLKGGEGMIQTHFEDGQRHGPSKWWHWNGKPAGTVNYVDGKQQGVETWWYENGRKMRVLTYDRGKLHGAAHAWHENGEQEFLAGWKKGKSEGNYTEWYLSGKLMTTRAYADGKRNSIETHWYENNQKAWEVNWQAGKEQGVRAEWYESGRKTSEISYKDGQRHGKAIGWYQNEKKSFEITYEAGEETRHLEWSESGSPIDLTEEGWNPDGTPRKTK